MLVRVEASERLSFQDALRNWQQVLALILREHYDELRRRGQGYVALVQKLKYEPARKRIVSRCQGNAATLHVDDVLGG